jgi:hypothetical protein
VAAGRADDAADAVAEEQAVGQSRQRVVQGLVSHALQRLAALLRGCEDVRGAEDEARGVTEVLPAAVPRENLVEHAGGLVGADVQGSRHQVLGRRTQRRAGRSVERRAAQRRQPALGRPALGDVHDVQAVEQRRPSTSLTSRLKRRAWTTVPSGRT